MEKEKHAYKCRFRSLSPPLLSMLQLTLVTTLQGIMCISQLCAFLCVTKLCQSGQTLLPRAGDAIHPALRREWSGPRD